jgi:hypothetical protein
MFMQNFNSLASTQTDITELTFFQENFKKKSENSENSEVNS